MKLLSCGTTEQYRKMCDEYRIEKIASYKYDKLKECYNEVEIGINKLILKKRLYLYAFLLSSIILILPQLFQFYKMIYGSIKRSGVVQYNLGKSTVMICFILIIGLLFYLLIVNRINALMIGLERRYKDIDFYLFKKEEHEFDEKLNSRLLLFDKDDRINTYFDSNQKRMSRLFVLGTVLLTIGILFIVAVLILTLSADIDSVEIVSGFLTGILIDFIGAVFIGMYNKTLESTLKLSKLINESRKANFSAYIASKVSDEKIRNEALSQIAVSIFYREKE